MSDIPSDLFRNDITTDSGFVIVENLSWIPPGQYSGGEPEQTTFPGSILPIIRYSCAHREVDIQLGAWMYRRNFKYSEMIDFLGRSGIQVTSEPTAEEVSLILEHYVGAIRKAFLTAGLWRRG